MGKRIYPLQRIKNWFCYDVDDVCALYKERRLHPQTVRQWLKNGLQPIDSGKPALFYGGDLRDFLGTLNQSSKCATAFHEMFCLKCKDAKPVFRRQIVLEHLGGYVKTKGVCQSCKGMMNKSCKLADIPKLRQTFRVGDVLELYDSEHPPLNTHLEASTNMPLSEPAMRDLFA